MKAKIKRGDSFLGCAKYIMTATKYPGIIGGNLTGSTAHEIATELSAIAAQRPDIKKPVWHGSLSAAPGERYSDEKWSVIVADYMQGLGFDVGKTAYVAVRHNDTSLDHIHIEASRVMLDGNGSIYHGRKEVFRAITLTQKLEKKYGLIRTKGLAGKQPEVRKPSRDEAELHVRKGTTPPRTQLQRIIDFATKDKPTQAEFESRLTAAGVGWKKSTGGYSYELDGVPFKGSQLGKIYSYTNIQKSFTTPKQLQVQTIRAAKAAAWEAERERQSRYRSNRYTIRSTGRIASRILPKPLGLAVELAAEILIAIATVNDWTQAQMYKQQVERLKYKLNRKLVVQVKIALSLAPQQTPVSHTQPDVVHVVDKQPTVKESNLPIQQPALDPVVQAVEPVHSAASLDCKPSLTTIELNRLDEISWEIVQHTSEYNSRKLSAACYDQYADKVEAEIRDIIKNVPDLKVEIDWNVPHPVTINGERVQSITAKQRLSMSPTPSKKPTSRKY